MFTDRASHCDDALINAFLLIRKFSVFFFSYFVTTEIYLNIKSVYKFFQLKVEISLYFFYIIIDL